MSLSSKKYYGLEGENKVVTFLIQHNYTILERNFSVRGGEIDIIAQKNDTIAFVEVKTRNIAYFNTSQVVTHTKQKKIIFAAKQYLLRHPSLEKSLRFDVALVEGTTYHITYIPHAFSENIA